MDLMGESLIQRGERRVLFKRTVIYVSRARLLPIQESFAVENVGRFIPERERDIRMSSGCKSVFDISLMMSI